MKNNQGKFEILCVTKEEECQELDRILWEVLWKPFTLPRNIRDSFKLEGKHLELAAKQGSNILGGLVAYWISAEEVELRHIAVQPEYQGKCIGTMLVRRLVEIVRKKGLSCIRTCARNSSIKFFSKLGFVPMDEQALEHPAFSEHGITFQHMQYTLKARE